MGALETAGFWLARGGPFFDLERVVRLRRGNPDTMRRSLIFIVIGWLPPVVLALLSGTAHKGTLLPLHLRYLFALPLLFHAEGFVDLRVNEALVEITRGDLFAADDAPRLREILARGARLRDSRSAALAIVLLAFGLCPFADYAARDVRMPAAHLWVSFISLPIFRVVMLIWIWRWVVWVKLVARLAGLNLRLTATHPDRAGGIGFIEPAARSFALVLLAAELVVSGGMAAQVALHGARPFSFVPVIAGFGAAVVLALVSPLALFTLPLVRAKRLGLLAYGALAKVHCDRFAEKWLKSPDGAPLGEPSVSSLTDMISAVGSIDRMRPVPLGRSSALLLVALIMAPAVPLVLTAVPLPEIVRRLFKLLLA